MARRAAPGAGPPLAHLPARALLLLLLAGAAAAQGDAGDKAALLAFKAGGDDDDDLASWTAATDPCGDGWDYLNVGWQGVTCCEDGSWYGDYTAGGSHPSTNSGRVAYVELNGISGYAVTSPAASLAALTELQSLYLTGTHAHGDAAALCNAVPGLLGWGSGRFDCTACDAYVGCPASASPVPGSADAALVGNDECTCCGATQRGTDPATGACIVPPGASPRAPASPLPPPLLIRISRLPFLPSLSFSFFRSIFWQFFCFFLGQTFLL